ncbi:MAG: leucine-rich repeat domain-containing protein [Bacteroidales bacterium]|nr:leucine-rich repeat domain-containing protein [Bacteroidales bacterium]
MKHIINKLSALILMLMCVSATVQAEIVHHEVCQPTLTSRGFTRECWEDTETGKIYADAARTQELVDEELAKAVTYMLLRENPIVSTSEFSQPQIENVHGVTLRWVAMTSYYYYSFNDYYKTPRYVEFKVAADNVSDARLVWRAYKPESQGANIVKIYVNGTEKFSKNFGYDDKVDYIFVLPLPELKKGDVVMFETVQTSKPWNSGQGAVFGAALEYLGKFANDDKIPPLVYHEERTPTLSERGYTRECWEDTSTGKLYADPVCVYECDATECIYTKSPYNPVKSINGFNQSEKETEADFTMNWAGVTTYSKRDRSTRWIEFTPITGNSERVVNARVLWFRNLMSLHYGTYTVVISVNGKERYRKDQNNGEEYEGFLAAPLPDVKKGDIVRFSVTQNSGGDWAGGPTFKACLEYNIVPCTHDYPASSPVCSLCGYVKQHEHTYNETETCSLCGYIDPTYTVMSGYVGNAKTEDIKWVLNKYNVLTYTGTGEMEDFIKAHNEWRNDYKNVITKVVIGEGITKIGAGNWPDGYFNYMSNLTEVSLPSTLKEIGWMAFASEGRELTSITFPDGLETIGYEAFSQSYLESVVIPASVTKIAGKAFYNNAIKSITLNGATTIGSEAFERNGCENIYLMSNKEVSAADDAFFDYTINNATLHVNNSLLRWAKATSPWNRFGTILPLNDYNVEYTDAEGNKNVENFDIEASNNTFTLTDGCKQLAICEDIPLQTLTYTRSFSAANTWQALYVPFEMEYSDWKDNFDVAAISNFHEYTDENGVTESIELEVRYVKGGKLRANTPYLIRAKAAGVQTIVLNDATLIATKVKSIDCSSTERKYTFTGTYDAIDKLKTKDYIFMSGGRLSKANNDTDILKSMRWYLTIEDYFSVTGNAVPALAKPMMIRMIDDDETTDIENISVVSSPLNAKASGIFSITGAKLTKLQRGINIVNGKKIVVK